MRNRPFSPLFATINVTGKCNLLCKYCFFHPRSDTDIDLHSFKNVIDELAREKVFFINISGGEPFLHPDINEILEYSHAVFSHVVVLTNGSVMSGENFELIEKIIKRKKTFPIQVSIDSINSEINSLTRGQSEIILENLFHLREAGADIVIAIVITKKNAEGLTDSIQYLSRFTKFFHIMNLQEVNYSNNLVSKLGLNHNKLRMIWDHLALLKKELKLNMDIPCEISNITDGCAYGAPCMAGFSHIVIDYDLKVRPCDRLTTKWVGNLSVNSLKDIWNDSKLFEIIDSPIPYCQIKN